MSSKLLGTYLEYKEAEAEVRLNLLVVRLIRMFLCSH